MISVYVSSNADNKFSHITESDLEVVSAGYAIIDEGDTGVTRPGGLPDYQLLYIKEGCGHFTVNNEEITLTEKTAIIFHPFEWRYLPLPSATETPLILPCATWFVLTQSPVARFEEGASAECVSLERFSCCSLAACWTRLRFA